MKIRITALIFSVVMLAVLLSGCGCEHEWAEATCLAPKTCGLCQQTEGEPLGHTWAEVSCAAPKTCTACGETEGEALPHTWVEANYQNPKTCSECGTTEGEPLTADFAKYGFKTITPQKGKVYDYVTSCSDKSNEKTVGKLEICEYFTTSEMKDNDKTSPWNLPYKAGYEWKYLDMDCSFGDNNAQKYGWELDCHCVDYYTIKQFSDSEVEVSDGVFENIVNYNGNDTPIVSKVINIQNSGWINHEEHCYMNIAVQVPVGYDGIVLVFHDTSVEWDDDSFYVHEIYDEGNENALFFRLD